jgi:hypothetical protein
VIKTLHGVPVSFSKHVDVTINDREFDVVARNVVILLYVLASLNDTSPSYDSYEFIAEGSIHLWYSGFLPSSLATSLKDKVGGLLEDSCTHTVEATHDEMIKKTWTFAPSTVLSVSLPKDKWPLLKKFLEVPADLTAQSAKVIRAKVVMSPERADYRERWYFKDANPSMRLAKQRFRIDGLLLPFGHPRTGFDVPNP